MAKEDYKISDIYQGGYSTLKPSYGDMFTGYRASAGSLGLTTDPRSANILQEVSTKLSTGVKQIEVAQVTPEVFDSVPKQQLKEVNRLSKLTGVDVSVHGPVIDTTGITQQGFSELNRESSERKVLQSIERSHELDPDGNIPVTFHSAEGFPGSQFLPSEEIKKLKEKGLAPEVERPAARLIVVNKETGRLAPLEEEEKFYPGEKIRKEIHTPEENLKILNDTEWDNSISQLVFNKERADEILEQNRIPIQHLLEDLDKGNITPETLSQFPEQKKAYDHFSIARSYLEDLHKQVNGLFSKAYKYGEEHQRKELEKLSNAFGETIKKYPNNIFVHSQAMQGLLLSLKKPSVVPQMHIPIEEFAVNQSSKTFGNAAFESYKKFKDKSPIVSIENPPAGFALSTGEELRKLVEKSREQFVERAVKEGISKSEAKTQAEKLIGATWDVGHINMLRKYGYSEEDIIKETEKIAPLLKHVHLSDNFGFEHTELPMGMGNVPIKEIMRKLGKKGYEAKKIIEAGQWWQHFKTPPVKETMEAMGSPIYSMYMQPSWNQTLGFQQGYMQGFEGMWMPQTHYETFGGGFAQLPKEIGGQRPGAQGSRMSGTPME